MTKQRAILLDIFRSDECRGRHRTADEILKLARDRYPAISRATVYNNLRTMEEEGLIRRITGEDGADMYDASFKLHGHLICIGCKQIEDISAPHMLSALSELCGKPLESYELKMRYLCDRCKAALEGSQV